MRKVPSLIRSRMVGLSEWNLFAMIINSRHDLRLGLCSSCVARHLLQVDRPNAVSLADRSALLRAFPVARELYASEGVLCRADEIALSEFNTSDETPGICSVSCRAGGGSPVIGGPMKAIPSYARGAEPESQIVSGVDDHGKEIPFR